MFTNDTLKGRVALITGGGSGIGLEIATHYARVGAAVMLIGRNEDRIEAAAQSITAEGGSAAAWRADVRNYDELQAAVQGAVERFGGLDILVNNAAGNFVCPTAEMSPRGWKTVIDIDLNGTFHGCHAAYPYLKQSPHGGTIISIVTMLGVTGWPGAAHCAAAKAGILSLSRTLAVEWGPDKIRVNTISPGPIGDTEGVRRMYIETGRGELEARNPMRCCVCARRGNHLLIGSLASRSTPSFTRRPGMNIFLRQTIPDVSGIRSSLKHHRFRRKKSARLVPPQFRVMPGQPQ